MSAHAVHPPQKPPSKIYDRQRPTNHAAQTCRVYECHGTFHGGCGMMIICEEEDVDEVIDMARAYGHDPYIVGKTTASADNEVTIQSRFLEGALLSSLDPA